MQPASQSNAIFDTTPLVPIEQNDSVRLFGDTAPQTFIPRPSERDRFAELLTTLERFQTADAIVLCTAMRNHWILGDYRAATLRIFYERASEICVEDRDVVIALKQVRADLQTRTPILSYHANPSGRLFDSTLADKLVARPTEAMRRSAIQTGEHVNALFQGLDHRGDAQEALGVFASLIGNDERPWFADCPEIAAFTARPSFDTLERMLTTMHHGHDVIKEPYLAVRAGWALQAMDLAPRWLQAANDTFGFIIGPERSGRPAPYNWQTRRPGIMLPNQRAAALEKPNFAWAKSWTDDKVLDFEHVSAFEAHALECGHPIVNGASGSANILGFLHREIAASRLEFSIKDAELNTLAFLIYDGGHSAQEIAAVHALTAEAELDASGALIGEIQPLRERLQRFQLNYLALAPEGAGGEAFVDALNRALRRTTIEVRRWKAAAEHERLAP